MEGSGFEKLPSDLDEAPARFREWFNHVTPESEKMPLDWAALDKEPFRKLLVLKCMRPDRLNVALTNFIGQTLPNGDAFVECDSTLNSVQVLDDTLRDSTPATPIYFILSPGSDVLSVLDQLAVKYEFVKGVSYHNISMGQGQDKKAMEALELGHRQGHWVILNNVHLMPRWLVELEKKLDAFAIEGSNDRFRVFLTSEPSTGIPIGVLNRSIKLTNEPPTGLKANLKRAFCSFSPEYINEIDSKMRAILFGLCHFHAIMIERKKFGPVGFNMMYPFSLGDLRDSSVCLSNYMDNSGGGKIPWEDLRYIFGQIMYGGHIVNDLDRLLCVTYLEHFMRNELLDEMELFPFSKDEDASFMSPSPTTYERYLEHIDEKLKGDTPVAFGLHPNAEIGFRTFQSTVLFQTLQDLQPREDSAEGEEVASPAAVAEGIMQDVLDTYGESGYDLEEVAAAMEGERGPFQNVLMLELEQMNYLLNEIKRSLNELKLGFAGVLTMTDTMEELKDSLFLDRIPPSWRRLSWASLRSLTAWRADLTMRLQQLNDWKDNPTGIPSVTWLSGLINPQSFLTAIRQQSAQATKQELDRLVIQTEVTKRMLEEIDGPSRDGAYVHGLFLQGARFDVASGCLDRSKPREMFCVLPVINVRAIPADKQDFKGIYNSPVYKTEQRGPTFVFFAQLRTKAPQARWVFASVACLLDVTS
jgi:dynein heavy chain